MLAGDVGRANCTSGARGGGFVRRLRLLMMRDNRLLGCLLQHRIVDRNRIGVGRGRHVVARSWSWSLGHLGAERWQ